VLFRSNKKHWNTIIIDGSIAQKLICEWIDNSYNLVVEQLPKHLKNKLKKL
jgi:predicted DNA-binding protein (MmcQ/YjbR family)